LDRITVRDLRIVTHIGVTEEERALPQALHITVEIDSELEAAALNDDVTASVDYGVVTTKVAELARSTTCKTLEHLAHLIVSHIGEMDGVDGVSVEIAKESPPVSEDVGAISVRITRP
jgi:dihydroneopterin aldolase